MKNEIPILSEQHKSDITTLSKDYLLFSREHNYSGIYHNGLLEIQNIIEQNLSGAIKVDMINSVVDSIKSELKKSELFYNSAFTYFLKRIEEGKT